MKMIREGFRKAAGACDEADHARISRVAREWTATFDTIPDYIAIIDGTFRITRVNKAMARLLGREPRDVVGHQCYELMHGRREPWPGCPHGAALRENRSITREVMDPQLGLPLLVTCSPFHDEAGALMGTVHVARDISEQKRADEEQRRLIAQIQEALSRVRLLSGLLPICSSCKKIRDDQGYWKQIEVYIRDHSEAEFTHGICPECARTLYPGFRG
ncbi:MAG: PAS domain-containing protein [Candidatus Geothermincolia bacterium]